VLLSCHRMPLPLIARADTALLDCPVILIEQSVQIQWGRTQINRQYQRVADTENASLA